MSFEVVFNSMEVLETKEITELVSEAIIKVCWVSDEPNANFTVITKEVGKQIAATIPGAPVVGLFDKETNDFVQHSRKFEIKDGELIVEDLTKPYGFVDPVGAPWYQDFEEDGITRTYLMCKAYLWTKQYAEAVLAYEKGQSMELDEKSISGFYKGDVFIFTEAVLDKLCILGDAYAPCFAGAKVMSTYAKEFESLAENLEKIIGRRYFVKDNSLIEKETEDEPATTFTLEYAIQLGWNLEDAIYMQLMARGLEYQYQIKGIYAENGVCFVIMQHRESLEFVKTTVVLTAEDTVELGFDMTAVTMVWVQKAPNPEGASLEVGKTAFTEEGQEAPPAEPEAPAVDFTEELPTPAPESSTEELATDLTNEFTEKLAEKEVKIAELEAALAAYQAAEEAELAKQKEDLVAEYTELLTEEETAPIIEKVAEYSLDELEAKFAIVYSRKMKAAQNDTATSLQVDIGNIETDEFEGLPSFMREAAELDKNRGLNISLVK